MTPRYSPASQVAIEISLSRLEAIEEVRTNERANVEELVGALRVLIGDCEQFARLLTVCGYPGSASILDRDIEAARRAMARARAGVQP